MITRLHSILHVEDGFFHGFFPQSYRKLTEIGREIFYQRVVVLSVQQSRNAWKIAMGDFPLRRWPAQEKLQQLQTENEQLREGWREREIHHIYIYIELGMIGDFYMDMTESWNFASEGVTIFSVVTWRFESDISLLAYINNLSSSPNLTVNDSLARASSQNGLKFGVVNYCGTSPAYVEEPHWSMWHGQPKTWSHKKNQSLRLLLHYSILHHV